MPPLSDFERRVVLALEETRSVHTTAARLALPEDEVQRVALMAFGKGKLDVSLVDY